MIVKESTKEVIFLHILDKIKTNQDLRSLPESELPGPEKDTFTA